jgi:hypothetical protein
MTIGQKYFKWVQLKDFLSWISNLQYINVKKLRGKKNLVEFTLNNKYTKNPHENIFKTQQHLGIHQNKWMPK